MTFYHLTFSLLFLLVPLLVLLLVWGTKKKQRLSAQFIKEKFHKTLIPNANIDRRLVKYACLLLAMVMIILAIMRPQLGSIFENQTRKGLDIVIALDTSLSMLSEDVSPNRMDRAKQEIVSLMDQLSAHRIGLIGFSGSAFIHCPLSFDHRAVSLFLEDLNVGLRTRSGSRLTSLVKQAITLFRTSDDGEKVLLIYSDGEWFDNNISALSKELKEAKIRVMTVGIGTTKGAPVPTLDQKSPYKKDKAGQIVISKLGKDNLNLMATNTKALISNDSLFAAPKLYKALNSLEKKNLATHNVKRKIDRYHYVLILALIFLCIEWLFNERKKQTKKTVIALFLIFFIFNPSTPLEANNSAYRYNEKGRQTLKTSPSKALAYFEKALEANPDDSRLHANLGNAHSQLGDASAAIKAYKEAIPNLPLTHLAPTLHNLGTSTLAAHQYKDAIQSLSQSLFLNPMNPNAKHNLELALQKYDAQQKQSQKDQNETDKKASEDESQSKSEQEKQSDAQNNTETDKEVENTNTQIPHENLLHYIEDQEKKTRQHYINRQLKGSKRTEEEW